MTAIGHFAVASETAWNPSIITFFMQLKGPGAPLTAGEFAALWQARNMPEKHPRFRQTVVDVSAGNSFGRRSLQFVEEEGRVQDHVTETVFPVNRFDLRGRLQQMQLDRWDLKDSLWHMAIAGKSSGSTTNKWSLPSLAATPTEKDATSGTGTGDGGGQQQQSSETMLLFRGHHALADGASMGAALADLFDEAAFLHDMTASAILAAKRRRRRRGNFLARLWRKWVRLVHFLVGVVQALLHQGRLVVCHAVWDEDPWKQIQKASAAVASVTESNSNNTRRTLSWSEIAPVDQVKWVAETLGSSRNSSDGDDDEKINNDKKEGRSRSNGGKASSITVNDVFVACVTAALAKQLDHHRQRLLQRTMPGSTDEANQKPLPRQKFMCVAVPVHMKGGVVLPGESVGNNIGAFVARVPGEMGGSATDDTSTANTNTTTSNSSVDRLNMVSRELHAIKRTPAAFLSHVLAKCLSYASGTIFLPMSWTPKLYAAANAGSIVVISNNRGSPVPVHIAGRRVESLYGFVPLPPGIPVGVVVMSYAGNVNCTVTAEQWAVPDGDQFMVWILEEYLRLVEAAVAVKAKQSNGQK